MSNDRPLTGIILMLLFCMVIPFADSLAKLIGDRVPLLQVLIVRFGMQAAILAPVALWVGQKLWWTGRINRLIWARTVLHILGVGLMYLSLRYLPLAEAVAIAFVMPFILLLLGSVFLGEEVGMRRLLACAVGFIGTLLVLQPEFADVGWLACLPLAVAVVFAVFMLVTRQIAQETDPMAMQSTSGAMALVLLLPLVLILPDAVPEARIVMPDAWDTGLLLLLGVLGTLGHLLMTWSLKFAPASTLAPMQYLEIPVAVFFGFLIFGDLPSGSAVPGIGLTILAGLYIVLRERTLSRRLALQSQPPAPPAA